MAANADETTTKATIRKKLVIIGDGAVGKTCLIQSYFKNKFSSEYQTTVFETYVTNIQVESNDIELVIWDTAGQEDYERLRPISYPDSDVIIMCYSIDSQTSLSNIGSKWNPEIRFYCPGKPVILVGLKKDLRNDPELTLKLRQNHEEMVRPEQGRSMANRVGAFEWRECSSKTRQGVEEIFRAAAKASISSNYTTNNNSNGKTKKSEKCILQ